MSFIEYNKNTGLIVKSKADILSDLISICKQAYGSSFSVVEGTEMYTFLDALSYSLANNGAAMKAVYDDFGFMTATGTPLDVLCSLAGISRRENESDNDLRARYYQSLFSKSVGAIESLKSRLINYEISVPTSNNASLTIPAISSVNIVENITDSSESFISAEGIYPHSVDISGHSIAVICKHSSDFPSDVESYTELRNTLSDIILQYKSLGCGVLFEDKYIEDNSVIEYIPSDIAYWKAIPVSISLKITMTYDSSVVDKEKNAINQSITNFITEYISSLDVGEDIQYSGIMKCSFNAYTSLGYNDFKFGITKIEYSLGTYGWYICTVGGGNITQVKENAVDVSECGISYSDINFDVAVPELSALISSPISSVPYIHLYTTSSTTAGYTPVNLHSNSLDFNMSTYINKVDSGTLDNQTFIVYANANESATFTELSPGSMIDIIPIQYTYITDIAIIEPEV